MKRRKTPAEPDIVEQLKAAIMDSGLSLNELSRRSGVDQGQLSRFMRGLRHLSLPSAAKACLALRLRLVSEGPVEE